jgi:ADP-heptose:LPS heptosyltransferase
LDLVGKTDLRQLVRLVHHAQGVLTCVNVVMHLAAAVEVKSGRPKNRACVVVAGGREPAHWEAYPHHQFIHTVGALRCCDDGGCWKARVTPLGDGDEKDRSENLCVDVVAALPRCLEMISAADVTRRIELYFQGGTASYVTAAQWRKAEGFLR